MLTRTLLCLCTKVQATQNAAARQMQRPIHAQGTYHFHLTPSVPEIFSYTAPSSSHPSQGLSNTWAVATSATLSVWLSHHQRGKNIKEFILSGTQAVSLAHLWRPPRTLRAQDWAAIRTVAKQYNTLTKLPGFFRQEKSFSTQASIKQDGYLTYARYMILLTSSRQASDTSCCQR